MKRLTKLLAGILGFAMVAPMGACGGDNPIIGGGGSKELLFWCNAGLISQWEERLKAFTEETGIEVRVEGVQAGSWGELAQQIATSAYSGNLPDCGDLATEAIASLVASDLLLPLDDYIERDRAEMQESFDQMAPILYSAHEYDGKMYSLPTTWNRVCLFYNKNVLSEAGIAPTDPNYPHEGWTIENFLYCCEKITANNVVSGVNNKYGIKLQNQYFLTIEPWLNAYGTSILSEDWKTVQINDGDAKQCFQMLYDIMNAEDVKHQYSPKFGGTTEYDLFCTNRLGFMSVTMEYVSYLYNGGFNGSANDVSKLREGYDVVSFPSVDGSLHSTIGVGACPIFKTSENKEEAWELAKFLSSKKFQEEYLTESPWAIPSIKSAMDILVQKDFFPESGELFYDALQYATPVPAPGSYSAIELEVRKWFGGYMSDTNGFTLTGTGSNSLDSLAATIQQYLGE